MYVRLLLLLPALLSSSAMASDFNSDLTGSLVQILMMLALVVGLILAIAWLTSKTSITFPVSQQRQIQLLETVSLGRSEKISLVKVGDKHLLLGITAQNIRLLDEVQPDTTIDPQDTSRVSPLAWAKGVLQQNGRHHSGLSSNRED